MSTIVTRAGKGSPLTHTELDANFTNLNNDKTGYITGQGGTVTQATSKSTAVGGVGAPFTGQTNPICGRITMNGAALAANTTVTFTLTSTAIAANDLIFLTHISGGTIGAYTLNAAASAGSASVNVRNITAGSLSEAIVIGFAVIKAAIA